MAKRRRFTAKFKAEVVREALTGDSSSVKRACRTTRSLQGDKPWRNRLQPLEISHRDQVWVADITYVRLNRRFIYVAVLMDVFTRMIRGWNLGQHLGLQALTLKPLEQALHASVPEIHPSDQGVQYLSKAYLSVLKAHAIEISIACVTNESGSNCINHSTQHHSSRKTTHPTRYGFVDSHCVLI